MKVRHTRDEIVGRTQREFEELEAVGRDLSPEEWRWKVIQGSGRIGIDMHVERVLPRGL